MTAPQQQWAELRRQWRQLAERVRDEVHRGFFHRSIWTQMVEEIERRRSPDTDNTFLASYSGVYADAQLMRLRRLCDPDPESGSLVALINRIEKNPGAVSQAEYISDRLQCRQPLDRAGLAQDAAADWRRVFDFGGAQDQVPLEKAESDRTALAESVQHVRTWADKVVAHLDLAPPPIVPEFGELHQALEEVAGVAGRYCLLLLHAQPSYWTPTLQGDWQEVFRGGLFEIGV